MSHEAISWVFDQSRSRGVPRTVLLAIAYHEYGDGKAWPGLNRLVAMAKAARSSVTRAITELEEMGEITISRGMGPKGVNIYTMTALIEARRAGSTPAGGSATGLPTTLPGGSVTELGGSVTGLPTTLPGVQNTSPTTLPGGSVTGLPTTLPVVASRSEGGSVTLPERLRKDTSTSAPTAAAGAGEEIAKGCSDESATGSAPFDESQVPAEWRSVAMSARVDLADLAGVDENQVRNIQGLYAKRTHAKDSAPWVRAAIVKHGYDPVHDGTKMWGECARNWGDAERRQYAPNPVTFFKDDRFLDDARDIATLRDKQAVKIAHDALDKRSGREETGSEAFSPDQMSL